ncbi:hypothetical protein BN132_441 [Cronobacter turicensis 564]|nr:hypothetical protein BN132_441 [Cronobacter turicensis 564]
MRFGGHHGVACRHQQRRVGDILQRRVRVESAEFRHLLAGKKSHGYLLNPSE